MAVQPENPSSLPPVPPPLAAQAVAQSGDEHVEPEVGFFQEAWVQNALPFVTSLAIHVTLIVMGFLLIEPYIKRAEVSQPTP